MAFCKYCGKEMVNGGCGCQASRQTFAGQQAQAGAFFGKLWNLTQTMVKKPVTAINMTLSGERKAEGLALGGIHLLLILLTLWIHLPIGDVFGLVDGNVRFGLAMAMLMVTAVAVLLKTVIVTVYQKTGKAGAAHPFSNLLGTFCMITVPGSALLILAFLFGFFAGTISFVLYGICIFSWILYSVIVIEQATFKDADAKALGAVIVQAIAVVLVMLVASLVLKGAMQSAVKSSFGNLF